MLEFCDWQIATDLYSGRKGGQSYKTWTHFYSIYSLISWNASSVALHAVSNTIVQARVQFLMTELFS
jgi:hypothetical protein